MNREGEGERGKEGGREGGREEEGRKGVKGNGEREYRTLTIMSCHHDNRTIYVVNTNCSDVQRYIYNYVLTLDGERERLSGDT